MTDLAVRTVRIRGTVPGSSPRAAAVAVLRAMVPTIDDHSVLIVRRLRLDGFRGDDARRRLAELRLRAARPAVMASGAGWSATGAESVWFRDEAEVLACLTADLIAGSASSRWYWRSRFSPGRYGISRLAEAWLRDARWLPVALRLLDAGTPEASVRAAAALTMSEAAQVLAALLPGAALVLPQAAMPLPETGLAPRLWTAVSQARRSEDKIVEQERAQLPTPETSARWHRLLPPGTGSLRPAQRELIAVAMVLAVEPAAPAGPLRAWARAVEPKTTLQIAARHQHPATKAPASPTPHRTLLEPGPDDRSEPRIAEDDAQDQPKHEASGSEPVEPSRPGGRGATKPDRDSAVPGIDPIEEPAPRQAQRPVPSGEPAPAAYELIDRWPDAGWSVHATSCYLLNLILRFEPEPSWADLLRLARRVLRRRPGVRRRARDPLWGLLHELSGVGRAPAVPVPTWWQPAFEYLSAHGLSAGVFAQPGRIALTRTHLDVILELEQIDIAVRVSGLDQNPGWVRSLGRIVNFHFSDAGRGQP